MVTHGVTFLPKVIIVLKDGKISEIGGYQALLEQNGDFADFLKTYITEMDDDSADEGMSDCMYEYCMWREEERDGLMEWNIINIHYRDY